MTVTVIGVTIPEVMLAGDVVLAPHPNIVLLMGNPGKFGEVLPARM